MSFTVGQRVGLVRDCVLYAKGYRVAEVLEPVSTLGEYLASQITLLEAAGIRTDSWRAFRDDLGADAGQPGVIIRTISWQRLPLRHFTPLDTLVPLDAAVN